ncbi:LWR-salt protein [Haloarcula pelagica]|uniref:LWR-salt protein n=1 Tax=Haloarcula pelagica TaxID=3033389 RepID=UPI0024C24FBF|nr:LWR-salt protein [Halomicroarcula sp. YJ-61-S]
MPPADPREAAARYVFRVRFRLDTPGGVAAEPDRFETTVYRRADPPGEPGWLFFRDNCWRGDLVDDSQFRSIVESELGVPVESVAFSELQTSEAHLDELKTAIAADLDLFNADSVTEVLSKYLGSSIRVE